MAIIEFKDVSKKYKEKVILDKFSLKIEDGEMISIVGPSGKGKSTILNIAGLLEKHDSGQVIIDGQCNIKANSLKATKVLREKIGYLFQNFALVDEESVEYNLKLALKYIKANKKGKEKLINDALEEVGLKDYNKRKIYELSGGEQQRVALARLMIKPSKIILADEPTGSLDEDNLKIVLKILKILNDKGKTIVIVTHDERVAKFCDRIIQI